MPVVTWLHTSHDVISTCKTFEHLGMNGYHSKVFVLFILLIGPSYRSHNVNLFLSLYELYDIEVAVLWHVTSSIISGLIPISFNFYYPCCVISCCSSTALNMMQGFWLYYSSLSFLIILTSMWLNYVIDLIHFHSSLIGITLIIRYLMSCYVVWCQDPGSSGLPIVEVLCRIGFSALFFFS